MAFFLEISGKSYKVPNKIIIGRGEPFTQLNQNRDVSRAHLCIYYEDARWFVKNLVHESWTTMYGQPLVTDKLYEIYPEDEIEFAGEMLKIPAADPVEFTEIRKNISLPLKEISGVHLIYLAYALLVIALTLFVLKEYSLYSFLSHFMMLAALFFLPLRYALRLYLVSVKARQVRHVYFGPEGFTVHFQNQNNHTFKLNEVENWGALERSMFIRAYGNLYRLEFTGPTEGFQNYLREHLPEQERSEVIMRRAQFIWAGYGLLLVASSEYFFNNHIVSMVLYLVLALVTLGMTLNRQLRQYWVVPISRQISGDVQKSTLVVTTFLSLWFLQFSWQARDHLMAQNHLIHECSQGTADACQKIDFNFLATQNYQLDQLTTTEACRQQNPSACHQLELGDKRHRSPSSIGNP
jgi:hypothetical protein